MKRTPFLCCSLIAFALEAVPLSATPLITEFMGKNKTTIADEDGAYSDWVEIYNPDATPVSLNQWYLTDSASNLKKWRFPDVTLAPGDFMLVWASGKNRRIPGQPLHTSFSLDGDGEYLALVKPDGVTIVQDFAPKFPAQGDDQSYGLLFNTTPLLAANGTGRYKVPTSADASAAWQAQSFNDASWSSGPGGFGYGLLIPGITLKQTFKNGSIVDDADSLNLLSLPDNHPLVLRTATAVVSVVNTLGDGPDSHYVNSTPPPAGAGDQYAMKATGYVMIPTAGTYTFGKTSDDGGRLTIDGQMVINDDYPHSPTDFFATLTLSAGLHSFEVLMYEMGGGDELEFYAAPGAYSSFDASAFRLVGDVANGGLAASTLPPSAGGLIGTNLQSQMAGADGAWFRFSFPSPPAGTTTLSLMTRHNDGFAAWINGTAAASDRAPATLAWDSVSTSVRPDADSILRRGYNITNLLPSLNASGGANNVLAIQGLKASAADSSFLLVPEINAASLDPALTRVFFRDGKATPGYLNGPPSSLGTVDKIAVSVDRGYYTAPITVALTTSTTGATIRYTTDGSTPTATNGAIYSSPLPLSVTTTLRSIAVKTNWDSSPVDTHTYLFPADIIQQSPNGASPPGWPAASGTGQILNFGMDPTIVNNANPDIGGNATIKSAILSLPAVSIVTDLPNLFDINGSQGIYSHPDGHGLSWERPASIEWISPPDATNPNGLSQFQINAGLRMRGGYSRSTDNPKHSFRLFFRSNYGASKLNYPLFGRRGAQVFDKIDLRTAQNYSWSFDGDSRNTFLREESSRQALLDMGNPGSHIRYVQLFLNGQYWGLYDLDERTEADFAASYFGGSDDDWDVVKSESDNGYQTSTTDGNLASWQDLWNKSKAHRANPTNENYFKMMGLAADGATPTADPVLLDQNNLIDYMLLTMWTGNQDGATSAFLGNERANNWYGSRRRVDNPRQGFRFFAHDFEHTMLDVNANRVGPFNVSTESDFNYSNPMFLHQDLTGNVEYRMAWADRIQKHMFSNGALTAPSWQNRMNRFATVVDQAIAAESARWGDAKHQPAYTRQDWINAQNDLLNYVSVRNPVVLSQLRAAGLYPVIDAPVISPSSPYQTSGSEVTITGPGSLYYMADGSDPRVVGGGVKAGAQVYTSGSTETAVIPWSAPAWKYLADGSNQGTAWRFETFNDSTWASGPAELGYGDGDEATVIPMVDIDPSTPGVQRAATYYFRKTFNVSDLTGLTGGKVTVKYDDAYTVYLNGIRVAGNLPVNAAYNYYSGSVIEDTIAETSIDLSTLHAGTNTLAVEIHQANNGSTDVSMNCSLSLTRATTATPIVLSGATKTFRFRSLSGTTWSALSEATYLIDAESASPANLAISKIMYHPADPSSAEIAAGFSDPEDFEYIEILNTGTKNVDLQGVYLDGGISYDFTTSSIGRVLQPGARAIVVSNLNAFLTRYGSGRPVAGVYDGNLSNSGETVVLRTPGDAIIRSVTYLDMGDWPAGADGLGSALVARYPADPSFDNNGLAWRVSGSIGGNPGNADLPAAGSYDAWSSTTFPASTDPAIFAMDADPDGDGRSNFLEYALATNPLIADQPQNAFAWSSDGGTQRPSLQIRRPSGVSNAFYELQVTDDLGTWTTVATIPVSVSDLGNGTEQAIFRDPGSDSTNAKRFLRLKVSAK